VLSRTRSDPDPHVRQPFSAVDALGINAKYALALAVFALERSDYGGQLNADGPQMTFVGQMAHAGRLCESMDIPSLYKAVGGS
jgi:hypothetical protein